MDATAVKAFCDTAARLLVEVGDYASSEVAQRKPTDDALVRQLRISVGALGTALQDVARMTPPPMLPMPQAKT